MRTVPFTVEGEGGRSDATSYGPDDDSRDYVTLVQNYVTLLQNCVTLMRRLILPRGIYTLPTGYLVFIII